MLTVCRSRIDDDSQGFFFSLCDLALDVYNSNKQKEKKTLQKDFQRIIHTIPSFHREQERHNSEDEDFKKEGNQFFSPYQLSPHRYHFRQSVKLFRLNT